MNFKYKLLDGKSDPVIIKNRFGDLIQLNPNRL